MQISIPSEVIDIAQKHVGDILALAMEHSQAHSAVVVFDAQCELAIGLTEAYRRALPGAQFIEFEKTNAESILAIFETLKPRDLVVLIQSSSFRLDAFRIRVELFNRSLKVIEHPHLANMQGAEGIDYIHSLAYDPLYYRGTGQALKTRLDSAEKVIVNSGGEELTFSGGLEAAKLNVGDYSQMKNIGGQFPIGEVFTEAKNLEAVNGRVRIFAFGDSAFLVNQPPKPITMVVKAGRVVDAIDSTLEFDQVLAGIRADEGEVWVRELGFGLNRAFSQERKVTDIGTYERMCGIHLSLGAKHAVYKKPQFKPSTAWHHVDVFAVTESVTIDGKTVYQNGAWQA